MELKLMKQWLIQAIVGLLATGAGLCMAIDAGFERHLGKAWLMYGTLALIVFQAGLCILIDSVRIKIKAKAMQ